MNTQCSTRLHGHVRAFSPCAVSRLGTLLVLAAAWAGCQAGTEAPQELPVDGPPIVSEYRALKQGHGTREVGESCHEGAGSDCASGLCLQSQHVQGEGAGRAGGYVCSSPCKGVAECPAEWTCVEFFPGAPAACVPPADWKPQRAQKRGQAQPAEGGQQ